MSKPSPRGGVRIKPKTGHLIAPGLHRRMSHRVTHKRAVMASRHVAAAIVNVNRGPGSEERLQRLRRLEWAALGMLPPEERGEHATQA